jgi:hypothetical protein
MFRTFASRALAAAAALAVAAIPAVSAAASPAPDPVPIGHNQFFAGLVFGTAEESQIEVACAGPATTGRPMAGQSVEAILVAPPAPLSAGFTGSRASTIRVVLSWIAKGKTVTTPIGTLAGYYEALPVPTAIVVPCGGTGTMTFMPSPGSKTAKTAKVSVTFLSPGV